jgi:hypothetical protein
MELGKFWNTRLLTSKATMTNPQNQETLGAASRATLKAKWRSWSLMRKFQIAGVVFGITVAVLVTCGGRWLISQRSSLGEGELAWLFLLYWDAVIVGMTRSLVRWSGLDWVEFGVNSNMPPFSTLCVIVLINSVICGMAGLIVGHCLGYCATQFQKQKKT